jgi:hypothetical protein
LIRDCKIADGAEAVLVFATQVDLRLSRLGAGCRRKSIHNAR